MRVRVHLLYFKGFPFRRDKQKPPSKLIKLKSIFNSNFEKLHLKSDFLIQIEDCSSFGALET